MIELTRVRLINWHNFQNVCIPFRMVTYMIGVNAVGKTTIMDAIRYCLTTKKEFNAAGNRLSGRTLQGSVHGKQREEGRFTRPGHTVSYVGVEFLDREKRANFVIVVRVESESPQQELRHVSQDWFITPLGTRLEELKFLDRENRPTKRETFKSSCRGLRAPKTQADTRRQICRVLGIGDAESSVGKKFNEVFHMGTSLKDIEDIGDFIRAYILPEPEIRVEELQSDMRELERLGETLAEAQNRETILKEIVASGRQARRLQKDVLVNSGFVLLAVSKKFSAQEETYQRRSEAANRELLRLQPLQEEAEEKLRHANEKLSEARRNRDEDPDYQATAFYREKETELAQEYRKQVKRQGDWEHSLEKLSKLLESSRSAGSDTLIAMDPKRYYDWDPERRADALRALPEQIDALDQELSDKTFLTRKEKEDLSHEKDQKSGELQTLRRGDMVFPQQAAALCDKINDELTSRGMVPDAKILALLLTMTDESWQECAEAALGQRRFDIIVPPEHYRAAKAAFTSLGDGVGDIALVDTPGLERDHSSTETPAAGSLADKLGTENHYARLYVNYLLGGLVCCDTQEELETYPRSVTRDRLRHQSYRLQRMRKPTLYIGANARRARIKALEEDLRSIQEQLTEVGKWEKRVQQAYRACQEFTYERHSQRLMELADAGERVDRLNTEINDVHRKIREFEENPFLRGLFDKVENCEHNQKTAQRERDDLAQEMWKQNEIVEEAQREINRLLRESETAETEYEDFCKAYPELTGEVEDHYDNAARTRSPEEIEKNQRDYQKRCENSLDRYVSDSLIPIQRTYNSKYADYPVGLEAVERYQEAYDTLVRIELERSKESLRKAQIRCKERFRKEILFRMKDDIANAKAQFKSLEQVMSQLTYGEEKYHFVLTDPKDQELRAFSQIIQDKNNLQITEEDSLFTREAMSQPAYEAQVDELMNRIMADINASALDRSRGRKNVSEQPSKYVDYRTYLDYDILVENTVTGMKVPLSQVSGDNSGGENQAPYYVAICASLLQIYSQSANCIRLVMLDEAFNNMTSDRIEPMMRMFRELGMQLVLISTAEKCSAIYPYCDIVYSVVKYGTTASLAPFERLQEAEGENG